MDGRNGQPPDKDESDEMTSESNTRVILEQTDIKQEPIAKEEPHDDSENIPMVSFHVPLDQSLDNLGNIKLEMNAETMKFEFHEVPDESSSSNAVGQNDMMQPTTSERKCTANQSRGNGNKNVMQATRKKHKCSSCEYTSTLKSNLAVHMRRHTGEKPFPCINCTKRFSRKSSLQSHMRTHVADFLFSCSKCLKELSGNDEKMEHEAACKVTRYNCDVCKEFSTLIKTNMESHMRVHSGERPFQCNQCSKRFNQQTSLKMHLKAHNKRSPTKFKCSNCYQSFSQQNEKDKHEVNCKRRPGFKCQQCTYSNPYETNLKRHMSSHTGARSFRCEMCTKYFTQKGSLDRHKKTHNQI